MSLNQIKSLICKKLQKCKIFVIFGLNELYHIEFIQLYIGIFYSRSSRNPIAEDFQSRSITNHSFALPRLAKIGHIYLQNKSNHFLWKNVAVSGFYCNVVLKTWVEMLSKKQTKCLLEGAIPQSKFDTEMTTWKFFWYYHEIWLVFMMKDKQMSNYAFLMRKYHIIWQDS